MTSEARATMKHIRQATICAGGARAWFSLHGINWTDFLTHGVPVDVLRDTGDALALPVIAFAEADHRGK